MNNVIERTLIVVKPDGVRRGLVDQIISYYEKGGLKIIAKKTLTIDKEFAEKHYAATEEQIVGMGNKTLNASKESNKLDEMISIFGTDDARKIGTMLREFLVKFITSGPVVAMVFEGEDAIKTARKITGFTDPSKAEKGTIRGDLGQDSITASNSQKRATENLVHASGNSDEAQREIKLWFDM